MKILKVQYAGIPIELLSHSGFMERFCKDYLYDGKPLFSVSVTEDKKRRTAEGGRADNI